MSVSFFLIQHKYPFHDTESCSNKLKGNLTVKELAVKFNELDRSLALQ